MKIVIVDDSNAVHAFLREMLDGTGIAMQHFYDGQEVVDNACSLPTDIDLVLLDWEMPRLTGIEALAKLRAARPDLHIVMMTSKNAMTDIV
jgi:CheY-like chemotaxis protein